MHFLQLFVRGHSPQLIITSITLKRPEWENPYTDTYFVVSIFQNCTLNTVSQRKCHFHWPSNTRQGLHISITVNILNTFIWPGVGADSGPRDYHPGGKPQSRLRSQVAVTCGHTALSCWMLLLSIIRKTQSYVSSRAARAGTGLTGFRADVCSAARLVDNWHVITMYTMYSLPNQMFRCHVIYENNRV